MFGRAISKLVESGLVPRFNPKIAEGVGYTQAQDGFHDKLHQILRRELMYSEDNPRLPIGLAVQNVRVMSPFEGYMYNLTRSDGRPQRSRPTLAIAPSDTYMASASFRVPGHHAPVCRQLNLPFIRRGGLFNYWGATYQTSAVLHQPGISREHDGFFVNFNFTRKVRLKFCSTAVRLMINGRREELFIPGTPNLYTTKSAPGGDSDDKALPYWLFGMHGFSGAIKRYCGVDVRIIPIEQVPEINTEIDAVVMIGDEKLLTQRLVSYALVVPLEALPSIGRRVWTQSEHTLLTMLAAFYKAAMFYSSRNPRNNRTRSTAGTLPSLFGSVSVTNVKGDIENLDAAITWREILGRSVLGTKLGDVEVMRSTNTHFTTECMRYVDDHFRGELMYNEEFGDIPDDMNLFDFLFKAIELMVSTRLTRQEDLSCMYGKRLTLVDYLLLAEKGFTQAISRLRWKLESLENKEGISRTIWDGLNRTITVNLVMRDISTNGAVAYHSASTESLVLGGSTHAILQTEADASRGGRGKSINVNDATKHGSASQLECGNVYYVPKSSPFKMGILNPYALTDGRLVLLRNPKLNAIIRNVEKDISQIGR